MGTNETRRPSVPLLMYHKVGAPVVSKTDHFLNVSARDFSRQMRLLARLGYEGITFADAARGLQGKNSLPKKPVCVTFDDGYECVADFAAIQLANLSWPATVFVPTAFVGESNKWEVSSGHPIVSIMGWERLGELKERGWEIAGHTHTHPRLAEVADPDAVTDILIGKTEIEKHLGIVPQTFCYPFGSVGKRTPEMVRAAGFIAACTTASGLARSSMNPYMLPRVKVAYRDRLAGFLYRLLIRPLLP